MFKTFIAGILLGIAGAAAAVYYIPAVDQSREQSMIVVHPNHGNTELFHVNVPTDRIMIGAAAQDVPLPTGLEWPVDPLFAGARAELFKLRNSKDAVVGVASRIAASDEVSGDIVEWVLHLPARGSVYIVMNPVPQEGGYRIGELATGTREFKPLIGRVTERWVEVPNDFDEGTAGRIELITAFVAEGVEEQ